LPYNSAELCAEVGFRFIESFAYKVKLFLLVPSPAR
jgi:hypothetical protein